MSVEVAGAGARGTTEAVADAVLRGWSQHPNQKVRRFGERLTQSKCQDRSKEERKAHSSFLIYRKFGGSGFRTQPVEGGLVNVEFPPQPPWFLYLVPSPK